MEKSEPGNAIYVKVGVWLDQKTGAIHIAGKDVSKFHTTVNNKPASKRGHPNLFMKLAKCLREAGAPHPAIEDSSDA